MVFNHYHRCDSRRLDLSDMFRTGMRPLIFFYFLLLSYLFTYANGGPIDGSFIHKTGNIRLIHETDIRLVSEKIEVIVDGDYCNVHVEYQLQNLSKTKKVQYGFPVDYHKPPLIDWLIKYHKTQFVNGYQEDYVKFFEIKDGDSVLIARQITTNDIYKSKIWSNRRKGGASILNGDIYNLEVYISSVDRIWEDTIYRRWYLTSFDFDSLETKRITVDYQVKSAYEDVEIGNDLYFSKRRFSYDLSPSRHWGNGVIDTFNLNIVFSNPTTSQDEHGLYGIKGAGKTPNGYYLSAVKFDLNKSRVMHLIYDNRCYMDSKWMREKLAIPQILNEMELADNPKYLFDVNEKSIYYLDLAKNTQVDIKMGNIDMHRLHILNTHRIPVKLKISIFYQPFGLNRQDVWESFIVDLLEIYVEPIDISNSIACKSQKLKRGHWDGQYFGLKAIKIEVEENQSGQTIIPLPELIINSMR